jgi:hypothetical protein
MTYVLTAQRPSGDKMYFCSLRAVWDFKPAGAKLEKKTPRSLKERSIRDPVFDNT